MKLKYTIILAAILLLFGLPDISKSTAGFDDLKAVLEFETNKESKIKAENGAVLRCSLQAKKSAFRNAANDSLAISVSSNWICR